LYAIAKGREADERPLVVTECCESESVIGDVRLYQYAYSQARVRARLASMASPQQWAYIAQAAELNNLIERMRANGLAFWLDDLPRDPAAAVIERHLEHRARLFFERLSFVFPRSWNAAARWLVVLPELRSLRLVLHREECALELEEGSVLRTVAERPMEERRRLLSSTEYRRLLDDDSAIELHWYTEFLSRWPKVGRRESVMQARFDRVVRAHAAAVQALRDEFRLRDPARSHDVDAGDAQWRLRDALAHQLRVLLAAGDPYHGVFILCYALLEVLQAEKARALLLAHAFDWRSAARIAEVV
jgi:hypothetical protein